MRNLGKLAVLGITALGLALAGPQDNSLVIGASQEPRVLAGDFLNVISNQAIKSEIEQYLFAPLIGFDANSQNFPVLATEVPTLENGRLRVRDIGGGKKRLEMDLTIRPDARWSDGKPITTEDVAFYYEVGKAKGMPVPNPDYWERVQLRVRDARNFTVIFEPAYYYDTYGGPYGSPIGYAPKHIMGPEWEKVKAAARNLDPQKDAERLNELYRNFFIKFSTPQALNRGAMVYSGPFMLRRWVPGNSVEMVRNPNFPIKPEGGESKYVQKVVYRFIQNTNSLLVAVIGGSIDATSSVSLTFDQGRSPQLVRRAPGRFDIWFVPGAIWEHIDVNKFENCQVVKDLGLNDKRTRQAILHALNREGLVKAFFDGLQPVAHTWIAPVNPLFNPNVRKYEFNPKKAEALLAEMGWRKGPDGILQRTVGGRTVRFEIEFVTTAGNAIRERTQQFFAEDLKKIGIAVKINNAPSAVVFADDFTQRASECKWTGMFMFAWVSTLAEDGSLFQYKNLNTGAILVPTKENNYQGQNIGGWRNDEFDRLTSQAVLEFDENRRKQLFARAQEIWAEELPALPLYFRANPYVVRQGLVNYVSSAYSGGYGYPGWNAWEIGWASRGAVKKWDQAKYALSTR
ncbi:ABC-type transporter, periplasmic subunit [Thermus thermophilus SG0.5JP17-16]|uniref:ABC-type transporter, periplasmic subunit n=1 Tax=Thermus thermophilus (strain SG0.5JP17-16) TaxID=762633 RepID=F6DEC2_THETG|nr:peptide ABC transporter substrate-binding protein [Thermus thermophilus]AEG34049.1 ABC-type transporter, periplasmic subunit [Thermus thermophilus SG0.5JP17-16]